MRSLASLLALAAVSASYAQTRPHTFDLKHVKWAVSLNPVKQGITGTTVNTLVPTAGAKTITLDAVGMTIGSVKVDGIGAKYVYKNSLLTVTLPKVGDGKKAVDVEIGYATVPKSGLYFVPAKRAFPAKTDVVYSQGEMEDNRNWLATYDYPDDKATSEGIIDVPKGWNVLSNGALQEKKTIGDRTIFHWKIDVPHATYLISVVAGPYSEVVERKKGIPVSAWVPVGLEPWGKAAFGKTAPIVDFFGKLTGQPYPYPKYAQSAVPDFMFGGMENISCTTQTITALFPPSAASTQSATGLVAHELAHQWFGDYVTTSGWSDIWINEGWATFLPNFYVRESEGQEAYEESRYGTIQGGIGASLGSPGRAMVNTKYRYPLEMFDGLAYPGGASRMFMLMDKLGEAKFWKVCKAYLAQKGKTSFDTKEFFRVWSKESGEDLTPFMNQWFFTAGIPSLSSKTEGTVLTITDSNGKFTVDVPVWIWSDGAWRKESVAVSNGSGKLDLGADAGKPYVVDPQVKVVAGVSQADSFPFEQRLALLENMTSHTGKLVILDRLLSGLSAEESLQVFGSPALKAGSLRERYVGNVGKSDAALRAMMNLAIGTDEKMKLAAVRWISGHASDQKLGSQLHTLAGKQTNPVIQQAFEEASLRITKSESLAESLWKRNSFNDGFRQVALSHWNSQNRDLARKKALEAIQKGFPEPTRTSAIRSLGGLRDEKGKHIVLDTLIAVTKESSFGARNAAIGALADYGDPKAIPAIKPFLKHPLVFFRNTAESALARLQRAK